MRKTSVMPSDEEHEYVLGTHDDEFARLGLQHRIWAASAHALWERAGLAPGQSILDVGCGPGYTSRDLALLAGPSGRVTAVDISERFIEHVRAHTPLAASAPIEAILGDVQHMDLPAHSFDFAYTRWVMCFVADPERVVAGVARALKPGGVFAVQDYADYLAVRVSPTSPVFERVFETVAQSWRVRGGDPMIGDRLPRIMLDCGLRIREIRPLVRIGRAGGMLWNWPTTFFRIFLESLVESDMLSAEDRDAFHAEWEKRSTDPAAYFTTPSMVEIIAEKID